MALLLYGTLQSLMMLAVLAPYRVESVAPEVEGEMQGLMIYRV